jgi:hypothetical protein
MKKSLLVIWLLVLMSFSFATIEEYYIFTQTSGTYNPFNPDEGNIIPELSTNNALSSPISIGFIFPYGANLYTEVKISSNGWIGLDAQQTNSYPNNDLGSPSPVLISHLSGMIVIWIQDLATIYLLELLSSCFYRSIH